MPLVLAAGKKSPSKKAMVDRRSFVPPHAESNITTPSKPRARHAFASAVGRSSWTTVSINPFFVQGSAPVIFAMEIKEYRTAIHKFRSSFKMALSLYEEGLINKEELDRIRARLAKKYGLKNKSVFIDK